MGKEADVACIKILFQNLPGRSKETHVRHLTSQSPGQDSNPVLPEYKVEALTTTLQSSIKSRYQVSLKGNNRSFLRFFRRFYLKYDEYMCVVNQLVFI
jgi:hypothetical protein